MALPLPKPPGAGGGLVDAMEAMNALHFNNLKRKLYAPDMESQINNRNALTEGQQISNQYMPEKLRLANAFAQLENQFYAPNKQSEINNRNALTNKYNTMTPLEAERMRLQNTRESEHPFINQPGAAGEIERLMYLENKMKNKEGAQGNPNNQQENKSPIDFQKLIDAQVNQVGKISSKRLSPDAILANDYADVKAGFVPGTDRTQKFETPEMAEQALRIMDKKDKQLAWKTAPADAKMNMLAYANGAGIGVDEAVREFAKGTSLNELYKKHGFDPKNPPEPDFHPTKGNITKLKDRQAALKEMNVIDDFVTEGLGPYSGNKVKGFSIKQMAEALAGMNKDQQAKFLAARALVPELNGLRLMAANAKATVFAIKAMQDKSLMNTRIFESLVTPDVWVKSQEYTKDVLNRGMEKSIQAYSNTKKSREDGAEKNSNESMPKIDLSQYNVPKGSVPMYDDNGRLFFIPKDKVDSHMEKGLKKYG